MSATAVLHPVRQPVRPSVRQSVRQPARSASRPAPGPVRLTRRGRWVVVVLTLAIVLGIGVAFSGGSAATRHAGTAEPTTTVVVRTGQTLWDIAASHAADGDVRAMVQRIEQLNALDGAAVTAGQRLAVPAS